MNPVRTARLLFWTTLTVVGAAVTGATGFLVVRGPFLGRQVLEPGPLLVATGGFMLGIIVLALGGTKLARTNLL
jgi:hypothetical protein